MGLSPIKKCSSNPYAPEGSGNPDPKYYQLLTQESYLTTSGQQALLVRVRYPDAKNYEGEKVMVYLGFRNFAQLEEALGGEVDPHFAETKHAPVARFRPTQLGWEMARNFIKTIP